MMGIVHKDRKNISSQLHYSYKWSIIPLVGGLKWVVVE